MCKCPNICFIFTFLIVLNQVYITCLDFSADSKDKYLKMGWFCFLPFKIMSFWNSHSEIQRTSAFSHNSLNIFHFLYPVIHLNWRVLYYRHMSLIYPLLRGGNWIYDGQNTAGNKIFTRNLYRFVLLLLSVILGLLRCYVHGLPFVDLKHFQNYDFLKWLFVKR